MLKNKKYFLFDIDGTLSVDETLYDGSKELIEYIEAIGGRSFYITNNSVKSRKDYVEKACELLFRQEVDYIGTNPDLRCPTAFGFVPDCGAICTMLNLTVDREPFYIGKPNKDIVTICMEQVGAVEEDLNETPYIPDYTFRNIRELFEAFRKGE